MSSPFNLSPWFTIVLTRISSVFEELISRPAFLDSFQRSSNFLCICSYLWDTRHTSSGWVLYKPSEMAVQHTEFYVFAQGDSAEEHHVVTSELQYELVNLNKFTEYSVWVVAFNQNGPGSSTEEVMCRTLSDVPSEPPQNVTLEASSSTVSTEVISLPP